MVKKQIIFVIAGVCLLSGCFKTIPENEDSNLSMNITIRYVESRYGIDIVLDSMAVTLKIADYKMGSMTDTTDTNGTVNFEDLPWSQYIITSSKEVLLDLGEGEMPVPLVADTVFSPDKENNVFTLYARGPAPPGLKINEVYTGGPPNNFFFFYDQYFELYNSSSDTAYLDGMIFCRMGSSIETVTYIFQFPGEPVVGREYPVPPDSFAVLAMDAYNFRDEIFGGLHSVDLSNADWEFVNAADPGDLNNNPDVPNIWNIEVGHTLDFMVGVTGDGLILGDGTDINYFDGIDIESVVDCVEYSASPTHIKEMPEELDKGSGGVGQQKYNGTSLERRFAGFDTNNSTVDFVIIPAPTVGYQHQDVK